MRARLTREGIRFVVLLSIVVFAAYNTRNNLIFLMLAVGVATLAVALVSGWLSLRRVTVEGEERQEAYAATPFAERLRLRSGSLVSPAFAVAVDGGAALVGCLPRGEAAWCSVRRTFPRRGLYRAESVALSTRFPFGLFRIERRLDVPRRFLVFPETRPIDAGSLGLVGRAGAGLGGRPGRGDELFRLRDYETGDAVHHIHWRTSAKLGRLIVRELGIAEDDRLALTCQLVLGPGEDGETFERIVTATASVARHLSESGAPFRFVGAERDVPPRPGREHLRAVLAHLAVVRPAEELPARWRSRVQRAALEGETVLVVATDPGALGAGGGGASPSMRFLSPETLVPARAASGEGA